MTYCLDCYNGIILYFRRLYDYDPDQHLDGYRHYYDHLNVNLDHNNDEHGQFLFTPNIRKKSMSM